MATNNFFKSDLPKLYHIAQNSMTLQPKELVIYALRDFFSKDSYYAYRKDQWGFPKTPDLTNTEQDAGVDDNITTRLFIGESYRFDVVYYPAIIVRHGGSSYVPVSFNRETSTVQWDFLTFEDGYGNIKTFKTPKSFIFAGAWEGSISIEVKARDLRTRDDLVDLISIFFTDIAFEDMKKAGVIVKGTTSSATNQEADRSDYVFSQTITLQIRSEWNRKIPVGNIVEIINTSIEFARTDPTPGPVATNLTINTTQSLTDILKNL